MLCYVIYERNVQRKKITLSQLGAEKIAFPPKPDRQTDIINYRVASLQKILNSSENP